MADKPWSDERLGYEQAKVKYWGEREERFKQFAAKLGHEPLTSDRHAFAKSEKPYAAAVKAVSPFKKESSMASKPPPSSQPPHNPMASAHGFPPHHPMAQKFHESHLTAPSTSPTVHQASAKADAASKHAANMSAGVVHSIPGTHGDAANAHLAARDAHLSAAKQTSGAQSENHFTQAAGHQNAADMHTAKQRAGESHLSPSSGSGFGITGGPSEAHGAHLMKEVKSKAMSIANDESAPAKAREMATVANAHAARGNFDKARDAIIQAHAHMPKDEKEKSADQVKSELHAYAHGPGAPRLAEHEAKSKAIDAAKASAHENIQAVHGRAPTEHEKQIIHQHVSKGIAEHGDINRAARDASVATLNANKPAEKKPPPKSRLAPRAVSSWSARAAASTT